MAESFDLDYHKRKYKNVHEVDPKDYTFKGIGSVYNPKIASTFCSANHKYALFHLEKGGGKNLLVKSDKPGRYDGAKTVLKSHNSVNYSEWCPYNDNMLATASKASGGNSPMCEVFVVTDDNFGEDDKFKGGLEPVVQITPEDTTKDLICVRWNPVVKDLLLVVGKSKGDDNIWVYNIANGEVVKSYATGFEVFSAQWDCMGNKIMVTQRAIKSKVLIYDPRTDADGPSAEVQSDLRNPYIFYCATKMYGAETDYFGVIGKDHGKQKAFIKFWDMTTLECEKEIKIEGTDTTPVPYFDSGRCMLWSWGKTESRIYCHRFFVIENRINWKKSPKAPVVHTLGQGITGGTFMGQRGLDFPKIEIQRFFSLNIENKDCYVYKLVTPRSKKSNFSPEFYPDYPGLVAPLTLDKWMGGEESMPVLWSLDPSIERDETGAAVFVKKLTYSELEDKLAMVKKFLSNPANLNEEEAKKLLAEL